MHAQGLWEVVGSCNTVESAIAQIDRSRDFDAAVLDIDLRGQYAGPVADKLIRVGIPFVITSGYEPKQYAIRFKGVPWLEKPVSPTSIAAAIATVQRHRSAP
jgi:DNA-binding NtrC family response regulator